MDTGYSVSILSETLYRPYFLTSPLSATIVKLVTYMKESIPDLGCHTGNVSLNGATATVPSTLLKVNLPFRHVCS